MCCLTYPLCSFTVVLNCLLRACVAYHQAAGEGDSVTTLQKVKETKKKKDEPDNNEQISAVIGDDEL